MADSNVFKLENKKIAKDSMKKGDTNGYL